MESQAPTRLVSQRHPSKLRYWLALGAVLVLSILICALWVFHCRRQSEQALADVIAETDRLDPDWRFEDLAKAVRKIPAEEDAGPVIKAAVDLLSPKVSLVPAVKYDVHYPQFRLTPKESQKVLQDAVLLAPAVEIAKAALPLKTGTYGVIVSVDGGVQAEKAWLKLRDLIAALARVAAADCEKGTYDQAWLCSLAILAAARSFGDSPMFLHQHMRSALGGASVSSLERCLAQGRVSDARLADALKHLAEESGQPHLTIGLRGERAFVHRLFEKAKADDLTEPEMEAANYWLANPLRFCLDGFTHDGQHARSLQYFNELMANGELPLDRRLKALTDLKARFEANSHNHLLTDVHFFMDDFVAMTQMQVAQPGIAVERYRLRFGRWPDSLDEVVSAKLLTSVPVDPYSGQALRYRKLPESVIVFSVGPTRGYNGEYLDRSSPHLTIWGLHGFVLWDENRRGQASDLMPRAGKK
jgi:hypothetical protein